MLILLAINIVFFYALNAFSLIKMENFMISKLKLPISAFAFLSAIPVLAGSVLLNCIFGSEIAIKGLTGSIIVNIGLVLGLSEMINPLKVTIKELKLTIFFLIGMIIALLPIIYGKLNLNSGILFLTICIVIFIFNERIPLSSFFKSKKILIGTILFIVVAFFCSYLISLGLKLLVGPNKIIPTIISGLFLPILISIPLFSYTLYKNIKQDNENILFIVILCNIIYFFLGIGIISILTPFRINNLALKHLFAPTLFFTSLSACLFSKGVINSFLSKRRWILPTAYFFFLIWTIFL